MAFNYLAALLLACAHLHGLATFYGPPAFMPGDTMANGEPLALDAPTVAVDVSLQSLLNRTAIVLTECGTLHKVKITDTGYLYGPRDEDGELKEEDQIWLRRGRRDGVIRYWPIDATAEGQPIITSTVGIGIEWLEDEAYQVVSDFPSEYFASIACEVDAWGKGDTMKVWIWVLE